MSALTRVQGGWHFGAQLHEHARLIAIAQTLWGRIAVLLVAVPLLASSRRLAEVVLEPTWEHAWAVLREPRFPLGWYVLTAVALLVVAPARPRRTLSLLAGVVAVISVLDSGQSTLAPLQVWSWKGLSDVSGEGGASTAPLVSVAIASFFAACLIAARSYTRLPGPVRRAPQLTLHGIFWLMLAAVWLLPSGRGGPFLTSFTVFVAVFPFLIWRIGYLLKSGQRGRAAETSILDHLFYLWPIWTPEALPYGKGYDYLSRQEAGSLESLARAQLAGVKLLVLSFLWRGALFGLDFLVYPHVPRLDSLVYGEEVAGVPLLWGSLYLDLFRYTLVIAEAGHLFVGCLRLCGFYVFRNSYRPLLSRTIIDFWNRFHYYFKELLVEFFFLPVYVSHFKGRPRVRVFASVMAAAFLGNLYYSALMLGGLMIDADIDGLIHALDARALYCLLLGLGVFFSMERQRVRRGCVAETGSWVARLRAILGVWTYYSIIHIWNLTSPLPLTFASRTNFFLSLFGLPPLLS